MFKHKAKKRIGIDARFYGPKQKGLGRYVQRLVENLEKIVQERDNLEFIIFLRSENWDEYQPKNPNFSKFLADYQWYGFKEQILMPWKIRQAKVDLIHFPHFNVPIFCLRPFVLTIHDLILKRFPTRRASKLNLASYWFKNLAYHLVISLAFKRAKKIIAVSEFTRQDIFKYFKVDLKKIKKIYEGAPKNVLAESTQTDEKLKKLKINRPYLLYVGNAYPHKNLTKMVQAFLKLNKPEYQLVLVGELDYFYSCLKEPLEQISDSVVFTDFVSDQELQVLYQNALAYIFPSLCEGFGLPPLEAMSYGLPVISSNSSCLPEILGKAALYFNPGQIDKIAEAMQEILTNQNKRKELISQGKERIRMYNWLDMAKQTLAVYQKQI